MNQCSFDTCRKPEAIHSLFMMLPTPPHFCVFFCAIIRLPQIKTRRNPRRTWGRESPDACRWSRNENRGGMFVGRNYLVSLSALFFRRTRNVHGERQKIEFWCKQWGEVKGKPRWGEMGLGGVVHVLYGGIVIKLKWFKSCAFQLWTTMEGMGGFYAQQFIIAEMSL